MYALAAISWFPGPQRKLIQRWWPRIVEHLATTIENNHERVLGGWSSPSSSSSRAPQSKETQRLTAFATLAALTADIRWPMWGNPEPA